MTTYNTISDSMIDGDSIVIDNIFFYLRDNVLALWEGDASAPSKLPTAAIADNAVTAAKIAAGAVGQSEIASGAVHRAELSTSTASGTTSVTTDSNVSIALTGGTYSWWTIGAEDFDTSGGNAIKIMWGDGNTAAGTLGFWNDGQAGDIYRDERYIQSSPPYDMGDGQIPLFIYLMIDNSTGKPCCIEVAQDPTWAYHGPTDLTPERTDYKTGRKYKTVRMVADSGLTLAQAKEQRPALYNEFRRGALKLESHEIEIDAAFKNTDMNAASNPWIYNKPQYFQNKTIVLLDPFGAPMQTLYDLQSEVHAKEVVNLIQEGRFNIGNEALNRQGPNGIQIVGFDWKNGGF